MHDLALEQIVLKETTCNFVQFVNDLYKKTVLVQVIDKSYKDIFCTGHLLNGKSKNKNRRFAAYASNNNADQLFFSLQPAIKVLMFNEKFLWGHRQLTQTGKKI